MTSSAGRLPRVLRLATAVSSTVSLLALIAVNLLPLVGVLFWDWSLMLILVLYWLESGIVGFINIFKIALARGSGEGTAIIVNRLGGVTVNVRQLANVSTNMAPGCLVPFFVMHYGIFWVVHGAFVFMLPLFASFGNVALGPDGSFSFRPMDFGDLPLNALLLGFIGLAVSHGSSFFLNFVGRGEYLRVTPAEQMFSVYGRVVALHLTIVVGAGLIAAFGTPVVALAILVVAKLVIDLGLHLRERLRAQRGAVSAE